MKVRLGKLDLNLIDNVNRFVVDEWINAARVIVQRGQATVRYTLADKQVTWPRDSDPPGRCEVGAPGSACSDLADAARYMVAYYACGNAPSLSSSGLALSNGTKIGVREGTVDVELTVGQSTIMGALSVEESAIECPCDPKRKCVPRCLQGTLGSTRDYTLVH